MSSLRLLSVLPVAILLAACDARIGSDAPPVEADATAAGKAEEGRLTIAAPGFNMSIQIPEGIRANAEMDASDGLIYPGSTFGGIHVQGRPDSAQGQGNGEVELRFSTSDSPDRVAAWYRDPARGEQLTVESAGREGDSIRILGTGRSDGDRFALTLEPRESGGTEARLVLSDTRR